MGPSIPLPPPINGTGAPVFRNASLSFAQGMDPGDMPSPITPGWAAIEFAVKSFCADNTPITQLRRLRDDKDASGFDRDTWQQRVSIGM
jgi:hypothetical protein|tara:strand:+ start:522 stop:788 length:267 start_codon:yes stop_codon:yes gene_type:complete